MALKFGAEIGRDHSSCETKDREEDSWLMGKAWKRNPHMLVATCNSKEESKNEGEADYDILDTVDQGPGG